MRTIAQIVVAFSEKLNIIRLFLVLMVVEKVHLYFSRLRACVFATTLENLTRLLTVYMARE